MSISYKFVDRFIYILDLQLFLVFYFSFFIKIHDVEFAKDVDVVVNECLPELEKIVKEGKAKFIGLTGYPLKALKNCTETANGRFDVSVL